MFFSRFPWRRFLGRIARRFVEENFDQISASLAFTTLLSLVPLVAVVLSIVAAVPFFPSMVEQLELFLARSFLPERSAGMIIEHVLQFSRQAIKVTAVGSLVLVATATMLLLTIERAFNHVWLVRETRSWWQRARLYSGLIVLWPLVIGGVLLATSHAVTVSLGLLHEPWWLGRLLFRALGLMIAGLFLGGLYHALPNTRVAARDAACAGIVATVGFIILQQGFELYLARFPSYTAVYGAFATVPVFLLWLYLSWAVVLLGALVAATLPEFSARCGKDLPP
ncbi:YihY family inner membrane protein [Accumulibacter sp.]|uniref:YihY family inner membrane protein n=1 Tax=Accumulibacter sp. TaxID=2053492 RepID=UPI0025CFEE38|nr:YihY family inner membrane protein [Accumulibacter sp.]MCM8613092.1 YihY family inner membrane protein [Accumulibacter sp.]MCM8636708.1 YihY family inner membrane protein [Accumulibacter sp.]MCM8640359.1 YihY family inner membrane protein [Accumulibacter sp.]